MDKFDYDYEAMLKGELYIAEHIHDEHQGVHGKRQSQQINQLPLDDVQAITEKERALFASFGENSFVQPPFNVDYGCHVSIGHQCFVNMDCIFLDVNTITLEDKVMVGPRVSFYTAGHPIDATIRSEGLEFGYPIRVKSGSWIGGNVVILPGVTIGENSIVAAGSVVTKDVPDHVIVSGNPARILRDITEQDQQYWQKEKEKYWQQRQQYQQ